MLREKIRSIENDLKNKNQKLIVYDQKLKQYAGNLADKNIHIKSVQSRPVKLNAAGNQDAGNAQDYNKCMNFNEYKYKTRPPVGPPPLTAQSRIKNVCNFNKLSPNSKISRNQNSLMSSSLDRQEFHAFNVLPPMGQISKTEVDPTEQLHAQIQELAIIRDSNNQEMIHLETELADQKKLTEKALKERDTLIEAMEDLTQKANQVEKTCQELSVENEKLMESKNDEKIIGLNSIIDRLNEEVKDKTQWGQELLEKYEKYENYIKDS